jgi:hypothetical protein
VSLIAATIMDRLSGALNPFCRSAAQQAAAFQLFVKAPAGQAAARRSA